jgi:hypothetical protein
MLAHEQLRQTKVQWALAMYMFLVAMNAEVGRVVEVPSYGSLASVVPIS